jgi:hypothetical protein
MGMPAPKGNLHHRRLSRDARHIVRHMLRRKASMHRASVLDAQVRALSHAVNRHDNPARALPSLSQAAPGQRVWIGTETRSLLRQLQAAKNLRVQQQLVREVMHNVRRRIEAAVRRSERIRKLRAAVAGSAARARTRARAGWERATAARTGRGAARTPAVRSRAGGFGSLPAPRTRRAARPVTRASRRLPGRRRSGLWRDVTPRRTR